MRRYLDAREFFFCCNIRFYFYFARNDRLDTLAYMTSIVFDMCLVCLVW